MNPTLSGVARAEHLQDTEYGQVSASLSTAVCVCVCYRINVDDEKLLFFARVFPRLGFPLLCDALSLSL